MKKIFTYIIVLVVILFPTEFQAQVSGNNVQNVIPGDSLMQSDSSGTDDSTQYKNVKSLADTAKGHKIVKRKNFNIVGYPYVFYKPETNFAVGASVITYFRFGKDTISFPSKAIISGYYTINKQWNITLNTQFYSMQNKLNNALKFMLSNDIDRFWGIGNDLEDIDSIDYNYNLSYYEATFDVSAKLFESLGDELFTGIGMIFGEYFTKDYENNPFLGDENYEIKGRNGGYISGFGANVIFDTRDNVFFPLKGHYHQIKYKYFPKLVENSFEYHSLMADLRFYQEIAKAKIGVLGLQVYTEMTFGDVPYFKIPRLGGDKMMRGYYLGRYRDNVYYMGQVEYRKQVADRFYLVAFFGLGRVTDKVKNITLQDLHPTYGLGLRFVLDVVEKLNIRLDIGFGDHGTSGVYFNAEEAF